MFRLALQSLIVPEKFQHILRIMNTNIDGQRKIMYALTAIKVCGDGFWRRVSARIGVKKTFFPLGCGKTILQCGL